MATDFDFSVNRSSELPLGAQLAWKIRELIEAGELAPGERLPSVRRLAELADVNVNTVRSVYRRLEDHGVVTSEQGRGTFVAAGRQRAASAGPADRAALRSEIERLEAELARRPQPPSAADPGAFAAAPADRAGGLLSAEELQRVRDSLVARLDAIEHARTEVLRTLERLDEAERLEAEYGAAGEAPADAPEGVPSGSRSASTIGPVRVRWVGGA